MTRHCTRKARWCFFGLRYLLLLTALALVSSGAHAQNTSGGFLGTEDPEAGAGDNTRLMGTAFDLEGNPMSDVLIWVVNDDAGAFRVRSKSRKTGNYLVRGMGGLYPRIDQVGIVARASYEKEGYETVEARVPLNRNGFERVYPILAPAGQKPALEGVCAVLVGTVSNRESGKGIKGAVVEIRDGGELIATSEETKKNGEFEILIWDSAAEVDLVISAPGGDPEITPITLEKAPQAEFFLARTLNVSIVR